MIPIKFDVRLDDRSLDSCIVASGILSNGVRISSMGRLAYGSSEREKSMICDGMRRILERAEETGWLQSDPPEVYQCVYCHQLTNYKHRDGACECRSTAPACSPYLYSLR